jgi:hypothetical protein
MGPGKDELGKDYLWSCGAKFGIETTHHQTKIPKLGYTSPTPLSGQFKLIINPSF